MGRYTAEGKQATLTTNFKTALSLRCPNSGFRRFRLYDLTVGIPTAPADNAIIGQIVRTTANGTDTAVTPLPLDPADVACVTTAGQNNTAEPTVTAGTPLLYVPFNQRATYRWVASPRGEIVVPAIASNGLAIQFESPAYVSEADASAAFEE